jgi:PIN domain nuclease of toxin-antitoxin system
MKYLLDTHTLLWLLEGDERLSERAREIIGDIDQQLFASAASLWEITIKVR